MLAACQAVSKLCNDRLVEDSKALGVLLIGLERCRQNEVQRQKTKRCKHDQRKRDQHHSDLLTTSVTNPMTTTPWTGRGGAHASLRCSIRTYANISTETIANNISDIADAYPSFPYRNPS